MDGKTFWKVRGELYERNPLSPDEPTYWCADCEIELDSGQHLEGCAVGWFERRFYKPEFRDLIR